MGWKNVKEHYNIDDLIVQVTIRGICIGTSYIYDQIVIEISDDGTPIITYEKAPPALMPLLRRLSFDLEKLKYLINKPDTFEKSIPVYTYDDITIIEEKCECLGFPNVTHGGRLMHDNTYSSDRQKVLDWVRENVKCAIITYAHNVKEFEEQLDNAKFMLTRWKQYAKSLDIYMIE